MNMQADNGTNRQKNNNFSMLVKEKQGKDYKNTPYP
jgi:hypothetical protein